MGDPEPQPAELLGQVLGAEHPGRAVGAAARALDHRVQVHRRAGELAGSGDEAGLQLPGPPPLADDEVAQHPVAGRRVVGGDPLRTGPGADRVARLVVGLARRAGSRRRRRPPPSSRGDESRAPRRRRSGRRTSTRACCGSATARPRARSARARSRRGARSAAARRRPAPACGRAGSRTAAPARGRRGRARRSWRTRVGDPVGARAQKLDRLRLAEVALGPGQPGPHAVARERPADEDDVPVGARDTAPALGERVDLELELRALAGARGGRGCGDVAHAPNGGSGARATWRAACRCRRGPPCGPCPASPGCGPGAAPPGSGRRAAP